MHDSGRRSGAHLSEAPHADCGACPHRDTLLAAGKCEPGDICLIVESGRQIDRFLRRNPEFAQSCLTDPFWERRAIAVRYAPAHTVTGLARDRDEVVRRAVALRLLPETLMSMARDLDREVHITVASRLPPFALARMAGDADPEARAIAASRMLPDDAARVLGDPEWRARMASAIRPAQTGPADFRSCPHRSARRARAEPAAPDHRQQLRRTATTATATRLSLVGTVGKLAGTLARYRGPAESQCKLRAARLGRRTSGTGRRPLRN